MFDIIVIGSGIGGLTAAALLASYGKRVILYESHTIAGSVAHSFRRRGFEFDSGPSFLLLPGIGVPAVAGSGILCANTLVSPAQTMELLRA